MTGIVEALLNKTGSTWVSQSDVAAVLKRKGLSLDAFKKHPGIVYADDFFTTKEIDQQENLIAENILRLLLCSTVSRFLDTEVEKLITEFEEKENEGRKLHFHQKEAVKMVVRHNFSVLSGGPGTGKTTVLSCIAYVLRCLNNRVVIKFTAPTGKASRCIVESTGEYANTTYKEFGITPDSKKAMTFEGDALFIDEGSMNDNEIMSLITKACKTNTKVCLVGDIHQLPSVGKGAVLRDIIASGVVPVTILTKTFRQDNDSMLFQNIENIKKGSCEIAKGSDYRIHEINSRLTDAKAEQLAMETLRVVYKEQVAEWGEDNVVILIPYRKSKLCSNWVNNEIQKIINPKTEGYRFTNSENHQFMLKTDDFVMQLENRDECSNGDVGKVVKVSKDGVDVVFGETCIHYEPSELEQLALAYAMSIHKSQGSQYPSVIMVLLNEHKEMLQRNLLYTGVTRAKKECNLICQKSAYDKAVKTVADENRITFLKQKLIIVRNMYRTLYGI